jgi:hypothetical protein
VKASVKEGISKTYFVTEGVDAVTNSKASKEDLFSAVQ